MPTIDERLATLETDVAALKSSSSTLDKMLAWLAPYMPWLKSAVAWAAIYVGGFLTSHYGLPPVPVTKEVPGPVIVREVPAKVETVAPVSIPKVTTKAE